MRKITSIVMVMAMVFFLFAGCSGKKQPVMYSNLADSASQSQVANILQDHGVTQQQTDALLSWADDFNGRVTSGTLTEGFQEMPENGADYAGLIIKNNEAEDGYIYPEANCRLTSYLLMKNMIHTNKKSDPNDTYMVFDVDAVDTYKPFYLTDEEKGNFVSLFNWVPLNGAATLEEHVQQIQHAWEDREIKIDGDGISLITVYLHGTLDDVRFVGHTGILMETKEGLLFVEKYGPQLPFQATKFNNREELKNYLLGRKDLYGDENELEPIVMENNKVL